MNISWESELTQLLERLSATQQQLLTLLSRKRELLVQRDHQGLAALASEEQALSDELRSCLTQRQQLLARATEEGLPADSIRSLADALPENKAKKLKQPMLDAAQRSKLLRHESLTQWVVVQRTLLHLSQMLEIIATGGRTQPTYGKGSVPDTSGSLMDQAV